MLHSPFSLNLTTKSNILYQTSFLLLFKLPRKYTNDLPSVGVSHYRNRFPVSRGTPPYKLGYKTLS